ncbi:MAG: SPFH domain-containing protein [Thermoplasmata archaeon]|nr:SPFH domain-containing protein [Thermoplasmata archaeon]
MDMLIVLLAVVLILVVLAIAASAVKIIAPYEQGIKVVLGTYRGIMHSGVNFVVPLITDVIRMDLRTQVLDVPRQEVITKDNSPTNVDAIIYIKVIDPKKAYMEVTNYRIATVALAQTTLRSVIGDMELDEILYNRAKINARLRDILDEETDKWGVKVEAVEIREVDPVGPVKSAMEEQTAAERQRRAAILRADGEKRSAILVAEGKKRAKILEAEGIRQSRILVAEGNRLGTILEAQGEAQRLRILSVGALPLDQKSLTVLSLEAVKKLGEGASTKFIIPFEVTKLVEGAAEYLGMGRKVPEREPAKVEEIEKAVGSVDDVLGPIPKHSEIESEINELDREFKKEAEQTDMLTKTGADRFRPPEEENPPERKVVKKERLTN